MLSDGLGMSMNDQDPRWYLAQLKPNAGRIAQTHLARQGFETFLPLEEHTRRQRHRFVTATRPLFPGYIFVQLDTAVGGWQAVSSTTGIVRLVRFGTEPAPVPDGLVAALRARCDQAGRILPADMIDVGDRVRLASGPLTEFVATVERVAPDRRVWLLMDLMGSQTRVQSTLEQLKRACGPDRRRGQARIAP